MSSSDRQVYSISIQNPTRLIVANHQIARDEYRPVKWVHIEVVGKLILRVYHGLLVLLATVLQSKITRPKYFGLRMKVVPLKKNLNFIFDLFLESQEISRT